MNEKLIVALDYAYENEARDLVSQLDDAVSYYKVGLELFLNTRGSIIDYLKHCWQKSIFGFKIS